MQTHLSRFQALDAFLAQHRPLWEPRPFHGEDPWRTQHPELHAWLAARDAAWVRTWEEAAGQAPDAPPLLRGLSDQAQALCELPDCGGAPVEARARWMRGVGGRKQEQILAFSGAVLPHLPGDEVADWCAGKAHLGRTLSLLAAERGRTLRVQSYELQAPLCSEAERVAGILEVPLRAHSVDVLAERPSLSSAASLIALHACGFLTDRAVEEASAQGLPSLFFSPCCHHKRPDKRYTLRSSQARALSRLGVLEEPALRLSTAQQVVGGERVRRVRENKMVYRLAYQMLIPGTFRATPESWVLLPFSDWAARLAEREGHSLPDPLPPGLLERAEALMWRRRALGVVRAPFRRPLELWMTLDRVLWLEELGFQVTLGTFCAPQMSPRNLLVQARRRGV